MTKQNIVKTKTSQDPQKLRNYESLKRREAKIYKRKKMIKAQE